MNCLMVFGSLAHFCSAWVSSEEGEYHSELKWNLGLMPLAPMDPRFKKSLVEAQKVTLSSWSLSPPGWEGSSYPESILADGSAEKTNGVQMHQQTSFRFLLEPLHAANICLSFWAFCYLSAGVSLSRVDTLRA